MGIVVFGSINVDITVYGERLPGPGETVHGDRSAIALGGKGCNQAVAVARLGGQVKLVGRLGDDAFGALARGELAAFGVSDACVARDPVNATGIAVIGVDAGGENCISIVGGANLGVDESDVDARLDVFEEADILLVQLEIPRPAIRHAAKVVRATGGRVILDPAPAPAHEHDLDALLAITDIITPNETETEALTGIRPATPEQAEQAAAVFQGKGVACAVIKMGAAGVYYSSDDGSGFVPPFAVHAVDSVAAGDCFNGGLAHALARGDGLGQAVRFAAACGALATTKPGASASAPNLAAVQRLLT